jgi:hypothetical protein
MYNHSSKKSASNFLTIMPFYLPQLQCITRKSSLIYLFHIWINHAHGYFLKANYKIYTSTCCQVNNACYLARTYATILCQDRSTL